MDINDIVFGDDLIKCYNSDLSINSRGLVDTPIRSIDIPVKCILVWSDRFDKDRSNDIWKHHLLVSLQSVAIAVAEGVSCPLKIGIHLHLIDGKENIFSIIVRHLRYHEESLAPDTIIFRSKDIHLEEGNSNYSYYKAVNNKFKFFIEHLNHWPENSGYIIVAKTVDKWDSFIELKVEADVFQPILKGLSFYKSSWMIARNDKS